MAPRQVARLAALDVLSHGAPDDPGWVALHEALIDLCRQLHTRLPIGRVNPD